MAQNLDEIFGGLLILKLLFFWDAAIFWLLFDPGLLLAVLAPLKWLGLFYDNELRLDWSFLVDWVGWYESESSLRWRAIVDDGNTAL
jgi:hypothetical protein